MNRLIALVVAVLVIATQTAAAAVLPLPIPGDPRDVLLEPFSGAPVPPRPMPEVAVPRHPYMAPNGHSNIHNDPYQTDSYAWSGPSGRNLTITSTLLAAECASVTFDSRGRVVTVCVSPTGASLRLMDPTTLATLSSYELPPRELGTFSFSNFSGGGYFYLDAQDRAVVSTFTGHLLTLEHTSAGWRKVRDVDVSEATGGAGIQSALPDWKNRLWFVTQSGVVGVVTRDGKVRSLRLEGETIDNSFSMDESGGVFIVSDHALYRFDLREGRPSMTWRQAYDRGSRIKPSQVSQGSGTTPTLIGRASEPGGGWIAITDNADPQMNVLVFRRGKAGPGHRPVCRQPVFPKDRSATENSLISVPGGLIVENNYGYAGPLPAGLNLRSADTVPGLTKVAVDYRHGGCRVAWRNTTARIPSVVSKVSLANGLIYSYTHPTAAELDWKSLTLAPVAPDSWYFTAFDARTGRQVWSKLVGSALGFNNNYAPVTLSPAGVAYVGVLGGLVRIADSP